MDQLEASVSHCVEATHTERVGELTENSILNTHYKTVVVMVGFGITVAGWWLWNVFLAGAYTLQPSPYAVRGGFFTGFGRDLSWWATLLVTLVVLIVAELGYQAVKRNLAIAHIWRGRLRGQDGRRQHRGMLGWLEQWFSWRSWCRAVRVGGRKRGESSKADDGEGEEEYGNGSEAGSDVAELPADKLNLGLWQEIEKDPSVQVRLRMMNGEGERGVEEGEEEEGEGRGEGDETRARSRWWRYTKARWV